jgi:L-2-hydroxyglutarate oxidase LhgO
MKTFDACVVGAGGVVGMAVARTLANRHHSVAAIEQHGSAAQETSGRNSNVIHSGFHEIRGTLKARLALQGSRLVMDYASRKGVPCLQTGMLIAVPEGALREGLWKEAHAFLNLWSRGRAHGVPFRFLWGASAVKEFAAIRAVGGIFIPSVFVIDIRRLMGALEEDALSGGAEFFYGNEVIAIETDGPWHVITTPVQQIRARVLINSAGLRASEISHMAGGPRYPIEFLRGDYYELIGGAARWKIGTLVYPAMSPRARSKGIHFGPRTDGRLFLGPNARPVGPGFRYDGDPTPKEVFLAAARRFLPEIAESDLRWSYCGVRPKLSRTDGKSDFIIRVERTGPPLVNLIGIDSPGLSASLAIAEEAADMVEACR